MRKLIGIYAVGFLFLIYLPVLFLPLFSFNASDTATFPLTGFTLDWYRELGNSAALLNSLRNSLIVAVCASVIATALGVLIALATTRHRFPGQGMIVGLILSPLVLPQILLAVALMILALQSGLGLTLMTVVAGHVLLCTPLAAFVLRASCEGMDPALEEASRDLGAPPFETFRKITLPLLVPGIVSSLLISFTVSFDEFILAFFLSGNEPTLPIYIWSQLRFPQKLPSVLALGTLILCTSICVLLLAEWVHRRSGGARARNPSRRDQVRTVLAP